MANEAVIQIERGLGVSANIKDQSEAYEKGAAVFLTGAYLVSGASSTNKPFGGFIRVEKISGDGKTTVSLDRVKGNQYRVKLTSKLSGSPSVRAGQLLKISGSNTFSLISGANSEGAAYDGHLSVQQSLSLGLAGLRSLEDTDTDGDTILAEII